MTLGRVHLSAVTWLVMASPITGCSDPLAVPPDTTSPRMQVVSPHDTAYDLDGDKLVDVSVFWRDSGGAVDPSTARLRSLRPLNGRADTTTNLLDVWRVVRRDTAGLLVRETIENLLRDGGNLLEVSVKDTAGNRRVDTLRFTLPHGAFYRTIDPQIDPSLNPSYENASGIGLDSAGRIGFMTVSRTLVVFDPQSLRIVANIWAGPTTASFLQAVVFDERTRIAYVSDGRIQRYDLTSNALLGRMDSSFSTIAMAFSRADPDLLYAGGSFDGWLSYYRLASHAWADSMQIPHQYDEFIFDMAVLSGDQKLYATRYDQGGILVIDPRAKVILKHVAQLGGYAFYTDKLALTRDERHIYVELRDANPRGVGDLDTQLDSIVRVLGLPAYVPQALALSPSQRRLFVTTRDRFANLPSPNVLVDIPTWSVIEAFPRHALGTPDHVDGQIVFRPDGKLIFVGRQQVIDVYLNREAP